MNLVITQKAVADFGWNFEEYKEQLRKNLEKYSNLVITETNYKESKEVLTSLGNQEKLVKEISKDFKDPFKKAIDEVVVQEKELLGIIAEFKSPIKEGIDFFVKKKEEEKRAKVENIRLDVIKEFDLMCKYAELLAIKDTYVRESTTLKKVTANLRSDAEKLKEQQERELREAADREEKKGLLTQMAVVHSQALGLKVHITFEEVKHLLDADMLTITKEIIGLAQKNLERENLASKKEEVVIVEETPAPKAKEIHTEPTNATTEIQVDEDLPKEEVTLRFNITAQEAKGLLGYIKANNLEYVKVEVE